MWLEGFILPISYNAKKQGGETPCNIFILVHLKIFQAHVEQ